MKNRRVREGEASLYYICHNVYLQSSVTVLTTAVQSSAEIYTQSLQLLS